MEADGLIECFQVSKKDRKLRCINHLGDGDPKLFLEISKLDIYPQKQVKKKFKFPSLVTRSNKC